MGIITFSKTGNFRGTEETILLKRYSSMRNRVVGKRLFRASVLNLHRHDNECIIGEKQNSGSFLCYPSKRATQRAPLCINKPTSRLYIYTRVSRAYTCTYEEKRSGPYGRIRLTNGQLRLTCWDFFSRTFYLWQPEAYIKHVSVVHP